MFIPQLDNLTLDSRLADLPSYDFQINLKTLAQVVANEFQRRPDLPGVMITEGSQIIGMISKTQFLECLSRPYGLETFLRRPILAMWRIIIEAETGLEVKQILEKHLVLSANCSIDKAVELALQRPASLAYEPIIIIWANGQRRLIDTQVLLLAQSKLFSLAKEAADAANRAKSEFLANMSHELRTPLNAILGFTQLMNRDRSLSSEQQKHLEIISNSGEHLLELINDVLHMSKIEAGRLTLNPKSFDLHRLLSSLQDMLQLKALDKGLQLIFDCSPNLPQYIKTDERKLREVLTNLLGNAIKYTQEGGVIVRVRTCVEHTREMGSRGDREAGGNFSKSSLSLSPPSSSHSLICFEVKDTGPGIAREELDKLFTAFGQTETGRQSQQGTGLGLVISQKFVQLMGGEISVSSNLGQGTTFAFQIPVILAEASETQTNQVVRRVIGLAPGQPKYRVLVVEDRPTNRLLLVKLLTSLGFYVYEAENGQEAIDQWLSHSPQLILMDMRMPIMDGYEASRQIRALESCQFYRQLEQEEPINLGKATTIIALTSSVFQDEQSLVLSAGCNDLVHKPFREEFLLEKISNNLGVNYLYEEAVSQEEKQKSDTNYQSLNLHLSRMPKEWLEKLNKAAIKGLDQEIIRLCDQIPVAYTPLANILKDWADDFLFDKVIELIQQAQVEV